MIKKNKAKFQQKEFNLQMVKILNFKSKLKLF